MNHTMPNVNESTKPVLVDRNKLRKAQRLIKANPSSWPWKQCMHMAKQAYGIECEPPMPEIGERWGDFIFTHVDKYTGGCCLLSERAFLRQVMDRSELTNAEVCHD
ncbi:hypothetical protein D3C81_303050 [compost metagenome]